MKPPKQSRMHNYRNTCTVKHKRNPLYTMLSAFLECSHKHEYSHKRDCSHGHVKEALMTNPRGADQNMERHDKLQCQPIDTQTGIYIEKQLRKFCQVHALNAFYSRKIVQPETMLTFCKAEIEGIRLGLAERISLCFGDGKCIQQKLYNGS